MSNFDDVKVYENTLIRFRLPNHKEIKNSILNNLSKGEAIRSNEGDTIAKTNFHLFSKEKSKWFEILEKSLVLYFHPQLVKILNVQKLEIQKAWYQQYKFTNSHGWHWHGDCNMIAIYFLELPYPEHKTQFINKFKHPTEKIHYEAEEGDIIFTNSLMLHQSPVISNRHERKTVISLNYNIMEH
tara:strand:+ start:88 stop:639 length:552 start_codon:yes stop_codon:yes gene_type:complete